MQPEEQKSKELYDADDVLDLGEVFWDYIRCIKKYWVQFFLIIIIATAVTVTYQNWSYEPSYAAKITYAVNKTGDTNTDAYIAKSLSNAVTSVAATADFKADLFQNVEKQSVNYNYIISSSFTEGANLFSITVTSNNYKNANIVMEAVERTYPTWAAKSAGTVELQTVDRSEATKMPMNPYSLIKSILIGLIIGLILCFITATWYAMTIKTVRNENDMKKIIGRSCIVSIPEVNLKKRTKKNDTKGHLLINKKRIDWGYKQSILALQSRTEKLMDSKENKVLMITSTLPQEGKSITAVNLALAFAKHGKKVLIIDGDMRNPTVGNILGIEESRVGLSDYFEKGLLDDIIIKKDGIHIIPAGIQRHDAIKVIKDDKMCDLMAVLRKSYDYIIIDTPPAHLFTDAMIFEKYADCVVYVVRYDMAELREIKEGIAPFVRNSKLVGYVINRNPGGFTSYGKYGYSKYGHYGKYKRYINMDESSMDTEESL